MAGPNLSATARRFSTGLRLAVMRPLLRTRCRPSKPTTSTHATQLETNWPTLSAPTTVRHRVTQQGHTPCCCAANARSTRAFERLLDRAEHASQCLQPQLGSTADVTCRSR